MHSFLRWLLIVLVIATVGYMAYSAYIIYNSYLESRILIGQGVAYEQHPADPTYRVLVAGDSTAVGVGSGDPLLSTGGRLGADMPNADITNVAVSGMKVDALLASLTPHKDIHYDLILIQIGSNDIIGLTSFHHVRVNIRAALALAQTMADHVIILTSGDFGEGPAFHWPVTTYLSYRTQMIRQIFIDETTRYQNVTYIDIFTLLGHIDFKTDIPRWYAPDLFHLTGEGYGLWYGEIKKVLVTEGVLPPEK